MPGDLHEHHAQAGSRGAGSGRYPLIHIADATAPSIQAAASSAPLLLATAYTMEQDFYKGHLRAHHQIEAVVPDLADRAEVHRIIYEELCRGQVVPQSKSAVLDIVRRAVDAGADGVIFGCTEIGLLVSKADFSIPVFDTTALHAIAALDFALSD